MIALILRSEVEQHFERLLSQISSPELRDKVLDIWAEVGKESEWETLVDAKFGTEVPNCRLVDHIESVTSIAISIARERDRIHGLLFDMDTLIVAGLLHDVGKLLEFRPGINGEVQVASPNVKTKHWFIGAYWALQHGLPDEIVNIIMNHTPQNSLPIYGHEAYILYLADVVDAALLRFSSGVPLSNAPLKKYK